MNLRSPPNAARGSADDVGQTDRLPIPRTAGRASRDHPREPAPRLAGRFFGFSSRAGRSGVYNEHSASRGTARFTRVRRRANPCPAGTGPPAMPPAERLWMTDPTHVPPPDDADLTSRPSWSVLSLQELNAAIRRERAEEPARRARAAERAEQVRIRAIDAESSRVAAAERDRYRNAWEHTCYRGRTRPDDDRAGTTSGGRRE